MKLTEKQRTIVNALAARLFPGTEKLPPASRYDFGPLLERFFTHGDESIVKNFLRLLLVFEHGTHIFRLTHKRYSELPPEKQDSYLQAWEDSSFYPRRACLKALKSVLAMLYTSIPEVEQAIGYAATRTA